MKNWRPISLLNLDLKIIIKAFASRLKTVLPSIIFLEQKAYIEKRFIGEGERLVSDILSVINNLKIKRYLVPMDIEKAFNSLDHSLLISVYKKLGLGKISLIRSKYCYISKNRMYWTVVPQQSILILKKVLVKVITGYHSYLFLHLKCFFYLSKTIPR